MGTLLSGCSTPEEIADKRERQIAYKLQQAEQRENRYKNICASYGFGVGTPQFNQCLATEKRQYEAEQRDAQATRERKALEIRMAKQAKKGQSSGAGLPMCRDGGAGISVLCE